MKVTDFNYDLPEELIAQFPLADRLSSRLMVIKKKQHTIAHEMFYDLPKYIKSGDCLVLNNTKVLPSRLHGIKEETSAEIEILLLRERANNCWEVMVKPAKRVRVGTKISFGEKLSAKCIETKEEGIRILEFYYEGKFLEILDEIGAMPLPPYIHKALTDKSRYQTVYAKMRGSAAAPTAGFHFTDALLNQLKERGVQIEFVTLHVGLGTFRPVMVDEVENHRMHSEEYEVDSETAARLNLVKQEGRRIVCVGTTSARTLEANYSKYGAFKATKEETDIFIYPPYQFHAFDGLITNFHLPKSTLLMLISAFAGWELIKEAYSVAIKEKYRFFSFGDAMLLVD